jgi:hypothetical protein
MMSVFLELRLEDRYPRTAIWVDRHLYFGDNGIWVRLPLVSRSQEELAP